MIRVFAALLAVFATAPALAQDFSCAGWQPPRVDEEAFTVSISGDYLTWSNGKTNRRAVLLAHQVAHGLFASDDLGLLFSVQGVDFGAEPHKVFSEPVIIHMTSLSPVLASTYTTECRSM